MVDLLGNKDIDRLIVIGELQRADFLGLIPDQAQADVSERLTRKGVHDFRFVRYVL